MKEVQKQEHLITPTPFFCWADHLCLSRCCDGSPLWRGCHEVFLHVLTEESFCLFTPELVCHIYRSCPLLQWGIGAAQTLSSWMLMTIWPPIDLRHKCNPRCKHTHLPGRPDRQTPSTLTDWSWGPVFVQNGHMFEQGSLGCLCNHVRWRKSSREKSLQVKRAQGHIVEIKIPTKRVIFIFPECYILIHSKKSN